MIFIMKCSFCSINEDTFIIMWKKQLLNPVYNYMLGIALYYITIVDADNFY